MLNADEDALNDYYPAITSKRGRNKLLRQLGNVCKCTVETC